jgi:ATP-dependent protease ClpP protease subunit
MNEILPNTPANPSNAHRRPDTERDFYMDAQQAKAYGLVDDIIEPRPKGEKTEGK